MPDSPIDSLKARDARQRIVRPVPWLGVAALILCLPTSAVAASARTRVWGKTPAGDVARLFTLRADKAELTVSDFGARLVSLHLPDRHGHIANILIAPNRPEDLTRMMSYAGATLGRYAGRIAGGRFMLDGVSYALPTNLQGNSLHGGPSGFHLHMWSARRVPNGVRMTLRSPDGDMGFPGALTVAVTYRLVRVRAGIVRLSISYTAATTRPTVLNLSNHAFFNLSGDASHSVLDMVAMIAADRYVAVDESGSPTGDLPPVSATSLDFNKPRRYGATMPDRGFDSTMIVRNPGLTAPQARVEDPLSGRWMQLFTTEPAIQLFLMANRAAVPQSAPAATPVGFSLEAQHFPNSPNRPDFPTTVLRPGATFRSTTIYEFGSGE